MNSVEFSQLYFMMYSAVLKDKNKRLKNITKDLPLFLFVVLSDNLWSRVWKSEDEQKEI